MPSVEGEQNRQRRHNPHPRHHKANAKPSSDKQDSSTLPNPPNPTPTPTKSKSILRRGSPNVTQQNHYVVEANSTPATPPRPSSMYDNFNGPKEGDVSAMEFKGQRRRKSDRLQGHKHSGSSSPMPSHGTPQSKERAHSMTPGRPNGTPLQAYAGPTFHASPAASSLPLPKFYSKSVPAAQHGSSLSAMMEKEVSEVSPEPPSDESEDSPTFEKAQRVGENQPRQESPLDIFFRADRKEKERQRSETTINTSVATVYNPPSSSVLNPPPNSSLPSNRDVRHHSRNATGSSLGELFSLEIDDKAPNGTNTPKTSQGSPGCSNSSVRPNSAPPSAVMQAKIEEEQRKAKTLLLKRLLMSPQLQDPANSSPSSKINSSEEIPSMCQPSAHRQPSLNPSLSGSATATPAPGLRSTISGPDLKDSASLPRLQHFLDTREKSTDSPRPRPNSSNLRKEITLPTSPARANLPELPVTPTPSQVFHRNLSPKPQIHQNNTVNGSIPTFAPNFSTNKIFQGMENASTQGSNSSNSTKSMEDDLRRILKLNILGGNGANRFQPRGFQD